MNINKLISLLTLFGLLAFIDPPTTSAPTTSIDLESCSTKNETFKSGEEIVYKIYYNWNFVWVAAGEVTFSVDEADTEYHFSAIGKSYESYDWVYRVRDRYDTYVDKKTLLPKLSMKTIEEGEYRLYDQTILQQNKRKAISLRGKTKDAVEKNEFELDDCMHDMLSIVYHARNINFKQFEPGSSFPIKLFMDETTYPLNVKYLGQDDNKKIKGQGKYKTLIFSPEVVTGDIFKENNQMKVWVSDDKNRIPLLIESPVSVGSIKAVLKSYKGLKHDFTAKVEG